jgi:hypothetical protein
MRSREAYEFWPILSGAVATAIARLTHSSLGAEYKLDFATFGDFSRFSRAWQIACSHERAAAAG